LYGIRLWSSIEYFDYSFCLDLLDKLLESRIRLQKSMQTTNTLPQQENIKIFVKKGGPQIKESYKEG